MHIREACPHLRWDHETAVLVVPVDKWIPIGEERTMEFIHQAFFVATPDGMAYHPDTLHLCRQTEQQNIYVAQGRRRETISVL